MKFQKLCFAAFGLLVLSMVVLGSFPVENTASRSMSEVSRGVDAIVGVDAFEWRKIITYTLPVFTLLLLVFMFFKHGMRKKPVPVVEFYPPKGMNPTELGYIIDEKMLLCI